MKIALAQIDILPGHLQQNFEKILEVYKSLESSVQLVVFPEMALPGYFVGDLWEQESFIRECEHLGAELARHTGKTGLLFGNVGVDWTRKNEDGRVRKYNAAFYAQNGSFTKHPYTHYEFWVKTLSPNYRIFEESRHFYDLRKWSQEQSVKLEKLLSPLPVKVGKETYTIGVHICEDLWDEDYLISPIEELCKQGSHVLVNLSASPYTFRKRAKRQEVSQKHVNKWKVPLLYVNCVGMQNSAKSLFLFDGASTVYKVQEEPVQAPAFQEAVLIFDMKTGATKIHTLEASSVNFLPTSASVSHTQELYQALTEGLHYIVKRWHISNVVIGVSGGIDSALSAALYTEVLGPESVYLVNMPSRFNARITRDAAKELAHLLSTPFAEVSIQSFVDTTTAQLSELSFTRGAGPLELSPLVLENIQARDRSARVLAAIAAARKGVFTCNANKTELTVGYCTLYGDAGGFLSLLGDLWKHQIYELARYINTQHPRIPQASLDLIPSAELSSHQNVNEGKGDPFIYPYHDALFKSWVEDWNRKTPEDLAVAFLENRMEGLIGYSRAEVLKFFHNSAEAFLKDLEHWWHAYTGMGVVKRVQTPPILVLSRRAFGTDHREFIGGVPLSRAYEEAKKQILKSLGSKI